MNVLVVVNAQNDFVTGVLGSKSARGRIPYIISRVKQAMRDGDMIIFTQDTHYMGYLNTQEGKKLPIEHCIKNTKGWEIIPELQDIAKGKTFEKHTSGTSKIVNAIVIKAYAEDIALEDIEKITFVGFCTDICVINNAIIAKNNKLLSDTTEIAVDASCCAGTTFKKHLAALEVMKSCQIEIENE